MESNYNQNRSSHNSQSEEEKYLKEPMRTQHKNNKLPKARESADDQVVICFSFVSYLESGVRFLDQSQSEVKKKKKQNHLGLLSTLN